jgi:hypothetical protein
MKKTFNINNLTCLIFLFLSILAGIYFLQKSNNALPFFFKDYPTYFNNGKKDFDSNSESLVLNRIDFDSLAIPYTHKFQLWRVDKDIRGFNDFRFDAENYNPQYQTTPTYLLNGKPYTSQLGMQALFYSKIASSINQPHGNYSLLKTTSVVLLSILGAMIILWIKINFGLAASLVATACLITSTGINIFSNSLYWSVWLIMAPLAVSCILEVLKIRSYWLIFLITFPVFLFKFTSGYEFITVIVFASLTPYAWDYFINNSSSALLRAATISLSSASAFFVSVYLFHSFYLYDFNLSGIEYISGRVGSWSIGSLMDLGVSPWTQLLKISILNFMDINGFGIPLAAYFAILTFIFIKNIKKISYGDCKFITFLLFASMSWLLIQPGHILFHPRYATLVFFIPLGLILPSYLYVIATRK